VIIVEKYSSLRQFVPGSVRQDYMRVIHTEITGNHLGVRRILDQVKRRAFWRGWKSDVRIAQILMDTFMGTCLRQHYGNLCCQVLRSKNYVMT